VGKEKISHRGFFRERLKYRDSDLERAFADNWERACKEYFRLENILDHKGSPKITQRDATIIATVIQWLGTNVGFNFVVSNFLECGYTVGTVSGKLKRRTPKKKSGSKKIKRRANAEASKA